MQTFADADEWRAVAIMHLGPTGPLPRAQRAFVGNCHEEPFALLLSPSAVLRQPPSEGELATLTQHLQELEQRTGCTLGCRGLGEASGAVVAIGLRCSLPGEGTPHATNLLRGARVADDIAAIMRHRWPNAADTLLPSPVPTQVCAACLDTYPRNNTLYCATVGCDQAFCADCLSNRVSNGLAEGITTMDCPFCRRAFAWRGLAALLSDALFDRFLLARCDKASACARQATLRELLRAPGKAWASAICDVMDGGMQCPNEACTMRFDSHEACACLQCPQCTTRFCAWCFAVFSDQAELERHVVSCPTKSAHERSLREISPSEEGLSEMEAVWCGLKRRELRSFVRAARAAGAGQMAAIALGALPDGWAILPDVKRVRTQANTL